jgi:hypothetical protein
MEYLQLHRQVVVVLVLVRRLALILVEMVQMVIFLEAAAQAAEFR